MYKGPPVFVADNKNLQYGEIGKPINISVKVYSTSEINCLHLNAIGSLNIKDIFKKSVPLTMSFHGVNITANGIEVTFHVAKLQSFQWFNITVCNNYSMNNFILEVRQTGKNMKRTMNKIEADIYFLTNVTNVTSCPYTTPLCTYIFVTDNTHLYSAIKNK